MNKLFSIFIERLMNIGKVPLCNGIRSRTPHLFGYCFPLCYRCTFIFISFFLSLFYLNKNKIKVSKILIVIGILLMIIDGCLQTFMGIESTNIRRVVTGSLFGFSCATLVNYLFIRIDEKSL